ncbi:MAG: PLxRFG domain-containing protein [Gemmatimonadales bacterium]|nr:PLxRFG domain-containing protein [Gemmatimonadales bacterium]
MNDPNGSKKAFDLYAKVRGVQSRKGSFTGATGTPVSNSLVELFTVMSYFAHDDLAARNQGHFDAWSGAYAVTETKLEYTATQKLKPRRVLASLTNLAAMHQIYSNFADTITMATIKAMHAEDVAARNKETGASERTEFPVPKIKGGGRVLVKGEITARQSEYMDYLVARMNAVQAAGGKPEYMRIDNALWVLTDARKMSLDIRNVDPTAERDENGKVIRAARSIKESYDKWAADRGTQLVFCDLSTPSKGAAKAAGKILGDAAKAIWGDKDGRARLKAMDGRSFEDRWRWLNAQFDAAMENPDTTEERRDALAAHFDAIEDADAAMAVADVGFSVYDDMREVLSGMGIPATEIAFIHDYETPAQKQKLFAKVNSGQIRVLMGSSQKMGAGTNAQERLVALHHMDAPWRPSDVEQREGRIIRQGNKLYERDPDGFEVEINAYSTEGTSDTVMWQVLQRKAAGIEQFREGGIDAMDEDGGDSDQYAEFMAASTGNPVFRYNLEAERAATDAQSQYGGRQIAKANALRFIENYGVRKQKLSDRIAAAEKATPGDVSFGGETGSIEELNSAVAAANRAFEKAFARFEEDTAAWKPLAQEARAQAEAEEAAGIEKKNRTKIPTAPEKPVRPNMMSPEVLAKSGYARAVKAALEKIAASEFDESIAIKVGGADLLLEKRKRHNGEPSYELHVDLDGETFSVGWSDARVPVNSPNMLAAFAPGNIFGKVERVAANARAEIADMDARLPKERETAKIEVSRKDADDARDLSNWYKAQVALAEVAADLKRADRPNSYIAADTKRPLKQFGSEGKEAPRTFEYGGEAYEGTGIAADGGYYGVRLYEATRRGDGKKAVVLFETKQDGEVRDVMVEPAAAAAAEMPTVSDRSGVRFKNAAALLRHLRSLPYGPLVDKLIAAGWLRIEDEHPAGKNYGGVTLAVPGDPELGLPRIVPQITLYATRLTPATASGVVLHEMFHGAAERLLGAEAFAKLLGRVDRIRRAQIAKLGGDLPDPNTHEGARYTSAEEFAAYSLEHRERGVGSGLAEAMDRILGAFKAFVLRRFGMQVGEVSDAQLRALAIAALRNEARRRGGDTPGSGVNAGPRSLSVGLRLPGDGTIKNRQGHEILQHRDVFKSMPSYADGIEDEADGSSVTSSDWPVAERGLIGNAITKAMGGDYGLLGLVPGRPLFNELAKGMPAAQEYLRLKGEMDALRSEWFAKTDVVAQRWRKSLSKDGAANKALMDLMHEATLAGADPSNPFVFNIKSKDEDEAKRRLAHADLKVRFDALPEDFQEIFREVRDAYKDLGDEFETTLLANVNKAMDVGLARAQRAHDEAMEQAKDDGLAGAALASVKAAADKKLATAKLWSGWNKKARMADLRMKFETSKVAEPYFPLARFGDFFVTVRDKDDGHVVAFSRFEAPGPTPATLAKRKLGLGDTQTQQEFAAEMRAQGYDVEVGTIGKTSVKEMVDPGFVTDIENILQNAGVPDAVMESVWQRWLETLPDFSIRKARIHRKGTPGFSSDAFRAFGNHMFHGSHQLARLRYSMELQEALELSKAATRHQPDPVRAGLIWQEMERRHEFAMNPKGAWWSQAISSAAFFFHLAFSPAAALVNLTQTTVIGIPILAGFHGETGRGMAIASRELGRALSDFTRGKGHALESDRLDAAEKAALREAYRRGAIDASQAHDLAGVAENGIEYSDLRTKWMGRAAFFFHHAERLNREVTFLAAYRMAKAKGMEDHAAIDRASDLTWRIHFDYQNSSKSRFMQGDMGRAFLTFRNYQANMIWRLVRDFHQSLHGASAEERREALRQLGGITASMALHAGIKGTWLYGLTMMLVGLLFEGGSDDAEEELQRGAVALLGRHGAALVLNGIPGTITGTALTERIGMPDLWLRSPDRPLEGKDLYLYWVEQMLGAGVGIVANQFVGADMIANGNVQRGIETMMPKFVRDGMRAARYATDGVETLKGDPIVEGTDPSRSLKQLLGFTPADVAERYEANSRMKNREQRIEDERSKIIGDYVSALRDGELPDRGVLARMEAFNAGNPDYPIMAANIRRSLQGKIQASLRNEFGASINPRLNDRIRREAAPLLSGE